MQNLIIEIKKGSPHAIENFYKNYSPLIFNYLVKKLPTKEDAEELTNEVFLEAIDSMGFLNSNNNLKAWLYKIAHNKMVDFYRKKKINFLLLSKIPYLELIANEISEPEFQFEKNKIKKKIEKTFLKLSDKHHRILKLHYEEKIPVKELAYTFNLSFKATESLLFRARKKFVYIYERS
jgi:RNA polymerase sigma factor (sigma-70 family)